MKNSYMRDNPTKWKVYYKKWYAKNKDKIKIYQKKQIDAGYHKTWVTKNKEQNKTKKAEWYQKNKKRLRNKQKTLYAKNSKIVADRLKKWRERYPERYIAQRIIARLKKSNKIVPLSCHVCGESKTTAHHEDYSRPLDVLWLCRLHHAQADSRRRDRELSAI